MSWLREFDAAERLLAEAVRCPSCGSTRVEYPQASQRLTPALLPGWSDLAEHDYHCERCNRVWHGEPEAAGIGSGHHLAA
jgi:DNA-directed RNA polymerase subunit RPC12/RpoP